MKVFKSTLAFCFLLFQAIGLAQASNAQKILGCWKIESVSLSKSFEGSDQMIGGIKNTVICFEQYGKFYNRKDGKILSQGTYSVTPDGKTINQSSAENESEMIFREI